MPLVLDRELSGARLAIWCIAEDEAQLAALVLLEDVRAVEGYGRAGRRLEGLAWRAAVRRIMPRARLAYNALGAPVVEADEAAAADTGAPGPESGAEAPARPWRHISVAHSGPYAVALLSETPCGVDIESVERDFSRAAARFIAPEEAALAGTQQAMAAVWCAKEAMYKLSGRAGLDLADDLRITALDMAAGRAEGSVQGGHPVGITFFEFDGYLVAWSTADKPAAEAKNLDISK